MGCRIPLKRDRDAYENMSSFPLAAILDPRYKLTDTQVQRRGKVWLHCWKPSSTCQPKMCCHGVRTNFISILYEEPTAELYGHMERWPFVTSRGTHGLKSNWPNRVNRPLWLMLWSHLRGICVLTQIPLFWKGYNLPRPKTQIPSRKGSKYFITYFKINLRL